MKPRSIYLLALCLTLLGLAFSPPLSVLAQEGEPELKLSLSRDFGYASGTGDIQGTFSMRVSGPDNLVKVEFLIDSQVVSTDTEAPFRFQFSTDNYPTGVHTMSTVGYTQDGLTITSNAYQRNFVSAEAAGRAGLNIIVPLFGIIFGLMLVAYVLPALLQRGKHVPLGTPRQYGLAGGTICSKCKRPFALNFLSLNIIVGKLDRCPHCGKWSIVHRYPIEMLRTAEAAELASGEEGAGQFNGQTDEEKLNKALDDSRYQDV